MQFFFEIPKHSSPKLVKYLLNAVVQLSFALTEYTVYFMRQKIVIRF